MLPMEPIFGKMLILGAMFKWLNPVNCCLFKCWRPVSDAL